MKTLTITQPDDWHLHLRQGTAMRDVLGFTAKQMGRAVVMPNLTPPITTATQAQVYYEDILSALPQGCDFQPLMTLYLTDNTTANDIKQAKQNPNIIGVKLYPAGATTNSDKGVSAIKNIYSVLEVMQQVDIPLLIHGEVVDKNIDVFDREAVFIETILSQIIHDFPKLRIILEHITTKEAVDFVLTRGKNIAATITPQHLLNNRNDMLVGGIRPHYFCLPILKREKTTPTSPYHSSNLG